MSGDLLQVADLRKSFGGIRALDSVSLAVPEGSISAVIGPNGAGKTTLFNVIAGALRPDSGSVRFSRRELVRMAPHQIARLGITRTFQTTRLFGHMSVLENVMTGCHVRSRAGYLAGLLNLPWTWAEESAIRQHALGLLQELGLGGVADEPAGELPFGRQRLVEIARALAGEPRLLLLDEPAAGLNISETAALVDLIRSIRDRGTTVLLVEHDMSLVMEVSESIVVLSYGRKIAEGPPRDVQRNQAVIDVYLGTGNDQNQKP